MRRYNQRLYRAARSIVRDEDEAEDVMQQAYVNAFQHLDQFAERASFATWLTRIAVHEALARRRRRGRAVEIEAMQSDDGEVERLDLDRSGPRGAGAHRGVAPHAGGRARLPAPDVPRRCSSSARSRG